jgi:AraC-like DNA-binding protein
MDALAAILRTIRIQGTEYTRIETTTPWGAIDKGHSTVFNILLQGEGYLEVEGNPERIFLKSGDACFILQGNPYIVRDHPYTRPETMEEIERKCFVSDTSHIIQSSANGSPMVTLSIHFQLEDTKTNPLLTALPPVILITEETDNFRLRIEPLFQCIANEAASYHPGTEAVISRLTEALFTQMVYAYLKTLPSASGTGKWLDGLCDPLIAPALGEIHQHPERPWKVADLAASVQLSPSAFSARFSAVVGESPLQYLTRWRMLKAAQLLREKQASIKEVAELVGYESEASLSNTFKKWMGVWPGAYRRGDTLIGALI